MTERTANRNEFLSDEPTVDLVLRGRQGDRDAVEALLQRCLPALKRWAHGRLPAASRGALDTGDLVQEAALHAVAHLERFRPQHVGAMQAYLRQSVINRIIDEVRRVSRRPATVELGVEDAEIECKDRSPLEQAIAAENYDRYRTALFGLKSRDRQIVVARIELQWSIAAIARHFGFSTVEAARMAVTRALRRLAAEI